jgi:hypothetical protein
VKRDGRGNDGAGVEPLFRSASRDEAEAAVAEVDNAEEEAEANGLLVAVRIHDLDGSNAEAMLLM